MKSVIQGFREWLNTCPLMDIFTDGQHIDWTDSSAGNYGIAPVGCVSVETTTDILGNVYKRKQYNIVLYARNWTVDDVVRLENTEFLDEFQNWVEEQQFAGLTPKFGDDPDSEEITAQNGMLFEMSEDGQTGLYQIQLAVNYEIHYEAKMLDGTLSLFRHCGEISCGEEPVIF